MHPVGGRLEPARTTQGARLIDDSYNANPSSMKAGIDVLTQLPGEPWLVMGDMGELGDSARSSHVEIGTYARDHGVRRLFATGELSHAGGGGLRHRRQLACRYRLALAARPRPNSTPDVTAAR